MKKNNSIIVSAVARKVMPFHFLMDYDKLEFVEAVEELAASAGLEVPYEKRPNQFGNKPDVSYQTKT